MRSAGLVGLVGLVALAAAPLGACSDAATTIRLKVQYEASWEMGEFAVEVDGQRTVVTANPEILIVLPDAYGEPEVDIVIIGQRAGERLAAARTRVPLRSNQEVTVDVTLERLPCGDWCNPGEVSCDGDGVVACATGSDGCTGWAEPEVCPAAAPYCSFGQCLETCVDECAAGESRCAGVGVVQACGQADSDLCLDWLEASACGDLEVCSAGACRAECQDECDEGDERCLGAGTSTCGDLDFDGCTEWSPERSCPDDDVCSDGQCAATCTDECESAACDGLSFSDCANYDLDDCLDRSPGVSCAPVDACLEGTCTSSGCDAAPRVCDAVPDAECLDAGTLRTYAEVGECTAGTCDYPFEDVACACSDGACACGGEVCEAAVIGAQLADDAAVVADEENVYWTTASGESVMRRSLSGGSPKAVDATAEGAFDLAIDATHVYWASYNGGEVVRVALAGGAPEVVATAIGQPWGMAIDEDHVYWSDQETLTISRVAKDGGAIEIVAEELDQPENLAVDGTHVYWTSGTGAIARAPKAGGATKVIATGQTQVSRVAVDATHVYWTSSGTDEVIRYTKSNGARKAIATPTTPIGLTLDGGHVYWTAAGRVERMAKGASGDAAVEIVSPGAAGETADSLFVGDDAVYWGSAGSLLRLSRCACGL